MRESFLDLDGRRTHILVGKGILREAGPLIAETAQTDGVAVVTNPTVRRLHGPAVADSLLGSSLRHEFIEVGDSETSKSLDVAGMVCSELSSMKFGRGSCVASLGGGVVGDLAGFVAATYMRGIGLVHIPTTLLAQVDSSIGGKTGVNIAEGKNLIGAFHHPMLVISDVETLRTLPDREFRSGLAEVVKYILLGGPGSAARLEASIPRMLERDAATLEEVVAECVGIKARLVEEDERDLGKRRLLNLGHTLGHALETATGYERYSHGEAVAVGLAFAARMSVKRGMAGGRLLGRVERLLDAAGLPKSLDGKADADTLARLMTADKKARGGGIAMTLMTDGGAEFADDVDASLVLSTLEEMME